MPLRLHKECETSEASASTPAKRRVWVPRAKPLVKRSAKEKIIITPAEELVISRLLIS